MALSKQDRNVGVTIAVVLIVCVVTLIAIGSILIRLVTPGIEYIGNILGAGARATTVDYNFPIPQSSTVVVPFQPDQPGQQVQTEQPVVQQDSVRQIEFKSPTVRNLNIVQTNAIGKRFRLENLITRQELPVQTRGLAQIEGQIYVPSLGLYSPILNTAGGYEALGIGAWLHPNSNQINQGEWGVLCERSLFQPFSRTSCLFLDELSVDDEILVIVASSVYKYQVVQPLSISNLKSDINNYSPLGKSLRIITSNLNHDQVQMLIAEPVDMFTAV